jgi:hypothetical protein
MAIHNQCALICVRFESLERRGNGAHRNKLGAFQSGDCILLRLANINQVQLFSCILAALNVLWGDFQRKWHRRRLSIAAKKKDRASRTGKLKQALQRWMRRPEPEPESPGDPYAYVGAPKKPRPPLKSGAVAVYPED